MSRDVRAARGAGDAARRSADGTPSSAGGLRPPGPTLSYNQYAREPDARQGYSPNDSGGTPLAPSEAWVPVNGLVQAILAAIFRSAGRLLNTAFGWATVMLFGRVPQGRQIYLPLISFGSVGWLIALVGIAFRRPGRFFCPSWHCPTGSTGRGCAWPCSRPPSSSRRWSAFLRCGWWTPRTGRAPDPEAARPRAALEHAAVRHGHQRSRRCGLARAPPSPSASPSRAPTSRGTPRPTRSRTRYGRCGAAWKKAPARMCSRGCVRSRPACIG